MTEVLCTPAMHYFNNTEILFNELSMRLYGPLKIEIKNSNKVPQILTVVCFHAKIIAIWLFLQCCLKSILCKMRNKRIKLQV